MDRDKTKVAVEIFDKLANVYQDKFMDVSLYGTSFDLFCDSIAKRDARILELGCGPGNVTKYLLERRPDFRILGTDLAPKMIELARVNNPTAVFDIMDCRAIDGITEKYDGLMCGFCLPYLSKEDAVKLIGDAYGVLNPGGVFYLSTMEDDYEKSGPQKGSSGDEIFMHFHEAGYLTAALTESGFRILDVQRKEYPGKDGATVVDLLLIASK